MVAAALQHPPPPGQGLTLLAEGSGKGAAPADWAPVFQGLMQQAGVA